MFCSRELAEVMHPPWPLQQPSVLCDASFDVSVVREALDMRRTLTYGLVVVDGGEATVGITYAPGTGPRSERAVVKLKHLAGNIASRTRRGGQSAARYSRNREIEQIAFLRKVAECVSSELGDLCSLIVGGRADMKRRLVRELPLPLRERVAGVVDIDTSAGTEGLQKVAASARQLAEMSLRRESGNVLSSFLELVAKMDAQEAPPVCFGVVQTAAALRLGAVKHLLLGAPSCSDQELGRGAWLELASRSGASVTEVEPTSEPGLRFCRGFGVGGCLRYPVDPELLEGEPADGGLAHVGEEGLEQEMALTSDACSDCGSASTAASRSDFQLLEWLQGALQQTLQDASAAESLAMCADVVLFGGDATTDLERLEGACEMLRGEGVPEDVLLELTCHVSDLIADAK